jgi:hypothetical protein
MVDSSAGRLETREAGKGQAERKVLEQASDVDEATGSGQDAVWKQARVGEHVQSGDKGEDAGKQLLDVRQERVKSAVETGQQAADDAVRLGVTEERNGLGDRL